MIDGIERIYEQLAQVLQAAIPEDWSSATLEAIFYPESSVYFGEYKRMANGEARSIHGTSGAVGRAFRELRALFKAAGKPLWGRAAFELRSDGHFDMRFVYDRCDEHGNLIFDETKELERSRTRRKRLTN